MERNGHGDMLPPADDGCLLIADITGYTTYLNQTELEHAQDVLTDLLERIVEGLTPVMHIIEVEGDAVFAYAAATELEASMLLDTVEQTYFGFRSRVRDVANATTCECGACRLILSLDLKFVVHHGRFVPHEVAGRRKLAGSDVVLVHRLLKNSVAERFGLTGYALFTEACAYALDISPSTLGYREHTEQYPDFGEVRCHIEDLAERWAAEKERRRVFVVPDEAQFEVRGTFSVPVQMLWDYYTAPAKRARWQGADRIDEENHGGRRGAGTTTHCVHGKDVFVEEILDWRPYRYFTHRMTDRSGAWVLTNEFIDQGDTSEVRLRVEKFTGWKRLLWPLMRRKVTAEFRHLLANLEQVLADDTHASAPVG